ncbi:L,D-transpeptidase [Actinomycetospora endophytica]|uniref:L,D-transpeptidase n=1 Tax=Actinomycetospora endophytica TaxID=2291215 RepID=A0ABS8P3M6_9PSEU|nr:L,D-transpeptidase [Actinomycetospora endophytica]MCD2192846.1 L,D-transpeptidase [Actinomycetospora endophytica]
MGKHHRTRAPTAAASPAGVVVAAVGLGALAAPGVAAAAPAPAPAPAAPAPGVAPKAPAPDKSPAAMKSPCGPEIKGCVSISKHTAWLTDGHGHTVDGPVNISTGGPGQETPTGQFTVQWKDANFHSSEYHGAPMPESVFFDDHGRAFHEGNLGRASGGCVHLGHDDARRFFDNLQPNDQVQIKK